VLGHVFLPKAGVFVRLENGTKLAK